MSFSATRLLAVTYPHLLDTPGPNPVGDKSCILNWGSLSPDP